MRTLKTEYLGASRFQCCSDILTSCFPDKVDIVDLLNDEENHVFSLEYHFDG